MSQFFLDTAQGVFGPFTAEQLSALELQNKIPSDARKSTTPDGPWKDYFPKPPTKKEIEKQLKAEAEREKQRLYNEMRDREEAEEEKRRIEQELLKPKNNSRKKYYYDRYNFATVWAFLSAVAAWIATFGGIVFSVDGSSNLDEPIPKSLLAFAFIVAIVPSIFVYKFNYHIFRGIYNLSHMDPKFDDD